MSRKPPHDPGKVLFQLTAEDVGMVADRMGIARRKLTEDVFSQVQKGIEWGLECWDEVVQTALEEVVKPPKATKGRRR